MDIVYIILNTQLLTQFITGNLTAKSLTFYNKNGNVCGKTSLSVTKVHMRYELHLDGSDETLHLMILKSSCPNELLSRLTKKYNEFPIILSDKLKVPERGEGDAIVYDNGNLYVGKTHKDIFTSNSDLNVETVNILGYVKHPTVWKGGSPDILLNISDTSKASIEIIYTNGKVGDNFLNSIINYYGDNAHDICYMLR